METISSPEELVLSTDPKSAHSPKENADVRTKRRSLTSFLRKQESSRPAGGCRVRCGAAGRALDPCFRRGDGGRGHTGILQACRRTRERHFLTSFLRKQESSRTLGPCLRTGDGGRGHTGILQACRRMRKRVFLTSFLRKQESRRLLDPCLGRGDEDRGHTRPVSRRPFVRGALSAIALTERPGVRGKTHQMEPAEAPQTRMPWKNCQMVWDASKSRLVLPMIHSARYCSPPGQVWPPPSTP